MYIRPHLDYCDVIYHIPSKLNPFESSENLNCTMQLIESTQYQAALAVSGTWKGTKKKIVQRTRLEILGQQKEHSPTLSIL